MNLRNNCETNNVVDYMLFWSLLTLAVCGLGEPCASFPDFCDNRQFHVIYCVSSHLCTILYFEEFLIHDSRVFMILKNN